MSPFRLNNKFIFIIGILLLLFYVPSEAQITSTHVIVSGGVTVVKGNFDPGKAGSATVIVGQAFVTTVPMAAGSYSMELGFWSGRLRQPGLPFLTASFEDFSDRIELHWLYDPQVPPTTMFHNIYKSGNLIKSNLIDTISFYEDNANLIPGSSYSYTLEGFNKFGASPIRAQSVGKISSYGEVTGQITSNAGSLIRNAAVTITPNWGSALFLNGTDNRAVISLDTVYDFRNQSTLPFATYEMWIRPADLRNQTIVTDSVTWELFIENQSNFSKLGFREIGGADHFVDKTIGVDVWTHIALVKDTVAGATVVRFYLNDSLAKVDNGLSSFTLAQATSASAKIFLGGKGSSNYFRGYIDEFRIWREARTEFQIARDFNRYIYYRNGQKLLNPGLAGLFQMDDFTSGTSMTNAANPSRGGTVLGTSTGIWTTRSFENSTLRAPAYGTEFTDSTGGYRIGRIPYNDGIVSSYNFSVTPSKPYHVFSPTVDFAGLSIVNQFQNNKNFKVVNLLSISGTVIFNTDNTNSVITGEQGVSVIAILGDNSRKQAITDKNGFYKFEVEPGASAVVEPSKDSRDSIDFLPSKQVFENIVENKTQNFIDTKARDMKFTVTGGTRRLPLGPSNMLFVTIKPTSGLWEKKEFADAEGSVRFRSLPPQPYLLTVSVDKTVPNAGRVPDLELMDTFFKNNGSSINTEESFSTFSKTWNGISDSSGLVFRSNIASRLSGFKLNTVGDIGFIQNIADTILISTFEKYYSLSKDYETSPLDSARIKVFDYVSDRWPSKDTVTVVADLNGEYRYRILPGKPNISSAGANPFSKKIEIEVADRLGRKTNEVVYGVVLGNLPQQMDFTTTAPEVPFLILRRPPGDQSVSSFTSAQSQSTELSFSKINSESNEIEGSVNLGAKVVTIIGFGVSTELEIEAKYQLTAGLSTTMTQSSSSSQVMTVSTQTEYSTGNGVSDASGFGDLDVFVGGAMNILYGITKVLSIKSYEGKYYYDVKDDIIFVPNGFKTTFIYTQKYITDILMPELKLLSTADPKKLADLKRWQQILFREDQLRMNAVDTANFSFEGGAGPVTFSRTSEVSNSTTYTMELDVDKSLAQTVGLSVNGAGIEGTSKVSFGLNMGRSGGSTKSVSNATSFTLDDDDFGDDYSVGVGSDPVYGTPVFSLVAGHSSCPYEEWKNDQGNVVSIARDAAYMEWIGTSILNNINPTDPAEFKVLLRNDAEEERTYNLSVQLSANSSGARIELNGQIFTQPIPYTLAAHEGFEAVVRVYKAPGNVYEYPGLRIKFAPTCESPDAGTNGFSLPFAVNFARPCTIVEIENPANNWVLNIGNRDTLDVIAKGFDLTQSHFEKIKLQYRPLGDQNWFTVESATVLADSLRSQNAVATRMRWPVGNLIDGVYDIRLITECLNGLLIGEFEPLRGTIDRKSPSVVGSPEPVDMVWNMNDEIAINFTEAINPATVLPQNIILMDGSGVGQITDVTITASENRLVVVPNIDPALIENHFLEATVFGYTDANGNPGDTVIWRFMVDRNPISWNQPVMDFVSIVGEKNTFSISLNNIGSQSQPFELQDLPTWLSATPMRGEINPGGSFVINFTVDPALHVGEFTKFVYAQTPKGKEPLQVKLVSMCQYPEWAVRPSDFQYSMNIAARVFVKGTKSEDRFDRIGAFVNGECRGLTNVVFDEAFNDYVVYLTVYSNSSQGEKIDFHIWDRTSCKEYWEADTTLTFINDITYGSPLDPVVMNATGILASNVNIASGFTWFSVNLNNPDNGNLDTLFHRKHPTNGDRIIGQTSYAQYDSISKNWVGPLSSEGIQPGRMYVGNFVDSTSIIYTGLEIAADVVQLQVLSGWNWIGYLPSVPIEINSSLQSLNSSSLDLIKDQKSFAQFVAPYGWLGNLQKLFPGHGYKLKSALSDTLQFPPSGATVPGSTTGTTSWVFAKEQVENQESPWKLNETQYQHTMTMTAVLDNDSAANNSNATFIGAFSDKDVRGIARPEFVPALNAYRIFMVVHGVNDEQISFKIITPDETQVAFAREKINFSPDKILGDPIIPFTLHKVDASANVPTVFSLSNNYPNPFNPSTIFSVGIPNAKPVKIVVYNILGQLVKTLTQGPLAAGFHLIEWNGTNDQGRSVASGVYFVVMTTEKFRQTRKAVLLR